MTTSADQTARATPLVRAALAARCPRCEVGPLFEGWVRFAPRCRACGLDISQFNVGDGPAAFLILIVGGLVTALALFLQLAASPPFWVHILLWVPLTTVLVVLCLRASKAALLILEYRNQAREGRLAAQPTVPDETP
ncbi:conserved hypothetical protein [Sphingobium sp. SYK-6]|uniref:DUF983 domain-containing protein n=1 Tax=Sphingobium sp. (strain NBRC 103272 / SYK-6) TaxID=627192 RepID=UPI0002276BED|nr:DUF983 domain-containing protein [Sphingobium sp. SYK-6]BAK65517.1 conserved hypothetical protein [Sphingobium sp. SYK-6]